MRVMVNGLPGKMATEVAKLILESEGFDLVPNSLTGPEINDERVEVNSWGVKLIKPDQREREIQEVLFALGKIYAVDFTHPNAINANVEFYCRQGIPFVAGTTGGDREKLVEAVHKSNVCAVIAPNMAMQVVAFQAMMEYAAENFPGAFEGFNLYITESHQEGKADTSGTAKAVAKCLVKLGMPFDFADEYQFEMIRSRAHQMNIGVPEQYLDGHGWHRYSMRTPDDTMLFRFIHNVNGRKPYAMGTLKALAFLEKKVKAGEKGKAYTMINVLRG